MRNARSRLESNRIARFQPHKVSVKPNIRRSFDHIYELFFRSLRMRPARSPSRRKQFVMHTESLESKGSSKRTTNRQQFIATGVRCIVGVLYFGPMADEIRASGHFCRFLCVGS